MDTASPLSLLLNASQPPELGPGPRAGVIALPTLTAQLDATLGSLKRSSPAAELIRATVLLWHDHFEPAHGIAQEIETADGSYIHAILHRREPDYANAKYWFRRVGQHPCYQGLALEASALAGNAAKDLKLVTDGRWDAFAFVDACAAAATGNVREQQEALRRIQQKEFELLLEHLLRA